MKLIRLGMMQKDAVAVLEKTLFDRPFTADLLARIFASTAFVGYARINENAAIISYILLNRVLDEAEILSLGTARNAQASGYATALLSATCTALMQNGVRRLFLDVAKTNAAARGLYRHCGFQQIGCRNGYYGIAPHQHDAIIMSKTLE